MNYDLEKRTVKFSKDLLDLLRKTKYDEMNWNVISQLLEIKTLDSV